FQAPDPFALTTPVGRTRWRRGSDETQPSRQAADDMATTGADSDADGYAEDAPDLAFGDMAPHDGGAAPTGPTRRRRRGRRGRGRARGEDELPDDVQDEASDVAQASADTVRGSVAPGGGTGEGAPRADADSAPGADTDLDEADDDAED